MWPFKRKQPSNGKVPPEVKKYYESEHRERVGLAWLIAFLSLVLTVVIVSGLFFGGRWAYRKIVNKNAPQTIGQGTGLEQAPAPTAAPINTPNNLQPAAPSQNDSSSSNSSSSQSGVAANSNSPTSGHTSSISTTTSPSQKSGSKITDTGPGNTVAIFIGATVLAATAHLVYQRRKLVTSA